MVSFLTNRNRKKKQKVAEGARIFKYAFYVTIAVFVCGGIGVPGGLLWLFFGTYIVAVSRARVAEVYGIPLNRVENWCLSLWCNCCVATQVTKNKKKPLEADCLLMDRFRMVGPFFLLLQKRPPTQIPCRLSPRKRTIGASGSTKKGVFNVVGFLLKLSSL